MTARDLCELAAETIASGTGRVQAREDWGIQEKAPGVSDRGFCELVAAHLLVDRRKWLTNADGRGNYVSTVTDFAREKKRRRPKDLRPPRILELLAEAERFQAGIEAGKSRAELAREHGLTRARVTQVMNLLKLDPRILAYIRGLPSDLRPFPVTERKLRALVGLPVEAQLEEAAALLPGFRARLRRSA